MGLAWWKASGYRRPRDKRFNPCSSSVEQLIGRSHKAGSANSAESSAFNLVRNGLSMPYMRANVRSAVRLPRDVLQSIDFPQQIAHLWRGVALPYGTERCRRKLLAVSCRGGKVTCYHGSEYCIFVQYLRPKTSRQRERLRCEGCASSKHR